MEESQTFEAPVEVLDALIELAYTSKLNLTGGNMDTIGQLLRIASKYGIKPLKQELSCHIKSTLSLSNALEFFKYASENSLCQKDIQLIRAYILKKNFMALNEQSNGFSNISQQDLESFIMDDNLGLKEEELFNLITGWVKNGYPERATLLNHVRYQFKKNPFKWLYQTIRRGSIASNPRNPNEMVLAFGGQIFEIEYFRQIDSVEIWANLGILNQPWRETNDKMPVKRAHHGIGLINKSLYVFGGESTYTEPPSNATYAFDLTKKVSTY